MKSTSAFLFSFLTLVVADLTAQNNVGIGTSSPSNKLEVHGNLLVTAPSINTNTAPSVAQTKTMINNTTIAFAPSDSTGRVFDPGGPEGDYVANIANSNCQVPVGGFGTGIQIWIESIDLAQGDSLIIRANSTGPVLLAVGNGYTTPGSFLFNSKSLRFSFKSDNNTMTLGAGFNILFKRIYPMPDQPEPQSFSGNTLYFDTGKGVLQSGLTTSDVVLGKYSVGLGYLNQSTGDYSIAIGSNSTASGNGSVAIGNTAAATGASGIAMGLFTVASGSSAAAIGHDTEASGAYSTAMGGFTEASGAYSTAMGRETRASGNESTAIGYYTHAYGAYSTAMGTLTSANGIHSTAMGYSNAADGEFSTVMGINNQAHGWSGTVLGIQNDPIVSPQFSLTPNTPLFIIGNGDIDGVRSNAMVVRKDGHVGIGANNPRVTLHIADGNDAGLADTAGFVLIGNVNGANVLMDDNEIMARDDGAASDLYIQHNGGKVLIGTGGTGNLFDVNGSAGKSTGSMWSTLSDRRLKENIQPYSEGLKDVLKINPVWYQYNTLSGFDTKPQYVGVIAQELQEIAPYMVAVTDKKYGDGSSGYLQVDGSAMTYMLINAVKELNEENILLKSDQAAMKDELAVMKSLLNTLLQQHSVAGPVVTADK